MLATVNRLPHLSIEELERDLETGPRGDLLELLCQLTLGVVAPSAVASLSVVRIFLEL